MMGFICWLKSADQVQLFPRYEADDEPVNLNLLIKRC